MDNLFKTYFPTLSERQLELLSKFASLLKEWNEKVNLISRKDIENVETNHILHSLAIAKFLNFKEGSLVIDLGTGGGLPGIPLAILFPDVQFHLIDRIGKKIRAAEAMAKELGLKNLTFQHGDISECKLKADFVVSRAVAPQPTLVKAVKKNISKENKNAIPNGLITLKGGDLNRELGSFEKISEIVPVTNFFNDTFFESKKIVFTPIM